MMEKVMREVCDPSFLRGLTWRMAAQILLAFVWQHKPTRKLHGRRP